MCRLPTTSRVDAQRQLPPTGSKPSDSGKGSWKKQKYSESGRSELYDKSNKPSVGASRSEGHGHGNSSLIGHKRKMPPHEQKKNILGLRLNRNSLKQNFNKELKPALALIVVSRVTSLRHVLNQSLPNYLWEQWTLKSLFPPL